MVGNLVVGHVFIAAEFENLSGLTGQCLDGGADFLFKFLFQQMSERMGRRFDGEKLFFRDGTCGGLAAVLTDPVEASPMHARDEETAQGTVDLQLIPDFPQMEDSVVNDVFSVKVIANDLPGVGAEYAVVEPVERLVGSIVARLELLNEYRF